MSELQDLNTQKLHELRKKAQNELDMCCQTCCNKSHIQTYIKTIEGLLMSYKSNKES